MSIPILSLSLENSVFRWYACCSSALVVKMISMSFYTGYQRFKNKAFVNPEDTVKLGIEPTEHADVERARRAHLNDLENIPLFFVSGILYTMTNPTDWVAKSLFLTYTISRITHSLVYAVFVIPQPARAISFTLGTLITMYITVASFVHFVS